MTEPNDPISDHIRWTVEGVAIKALLPADAYATLLELTEERALALTEAATRKPIGAEEFMNDVIATATGRGQRSAQVIPTTPSERLNAEITKQVEKALEPIERDWQTHTTLAQKVRWVVRQYLRDHEQLEVLRAETDATWRGVREVVVKHTAAAVREGGTPSHQTDKALAHLKYIIARRDQQISDLQNALGTRDERISELLAASRLPADTEPSMVFKGDSATANGPQESLPDRCGGRVEMIDGGLAQCVRQRNHSGECEAAGE